MSQFFRVCYRIVVKNFVCFVFVIYQRGGKPESKKMVIPLPTDKVMNEFVL